MHLLWRVSGILAVVVLLSKMVCMFFRNIEGNEPMDLDDDCAECPGVDLSDPNNVAILAQNNSKKIKKLNTFLTDMQSKVDANTTKLVDVQSQVNALAEAQNGLAEDMVGKTEPEISGI